MFRKHSLQRKYHMQMRVLPFPFGWYSLLQHLAQSPRNNATADVFRKDTLIFTKTQHCNTVALRQIRCGPSKTKSVWLLPFPYQMQSVFSTVWWSSRANHRWWECNKQSCLSRKAIILTMLIIPNYTLEKCRRGNIIVESGQRKLEHARPCNKIFKKFVKNNTCNLSHLASSGGRS